MSTKQFTGQQIICDGPCHKPYGKVNVRIVDTRAQAVADGWRAVKKPSSVKAGWERTIDLCPECPDEAPAS